MRTTLPGKVLYEIVFTMLFLFFLFVVYLIWERNREPLQAINDIDLEAQLIDSSNAVDSLIAGRRIYSDVTIFSESTDTVKAVISFPPGFMQKKLPVITILGGLRIGLQNFSFIKNPGENIIVIFIYPYQAVQWDNGFLLNEIPRIRQAVLKTPGQITELLHWIQKQEWTDTAKVSLLGYSFGALFLPAVDQVAASRQVKTGPSIISYGGANFELLLNTNLKIKPKWLRPFVAWLAATMIYTVDPIHHAAGMQDNIYMINGRFDEQIPTESWKLLHTLAPQSTKIEILDEGHLHPRRPELTQKLVDMSRVWLKKQGILN